MKTTINLLIYKYVLKTSSLDEWDGSEGKTIATKRDSSQDTHGKRREPVLISLGYTCALG